MSVPDECDFGDPVLLSAGTLVWASLVFSVVLQVVLFVAVAAKGSDKVTDLAYGMNFALVAIFSYFLGVNLEDGPFRLRPLLLSLWMFIYGVRLAGYLYYRILKIGKDDRFDETRDNKVKFFIWFLLQAITVWVVSLPVVVVNGIDAGGRNCPVRNLDSCCQEDVPDFGWVSAVGMLILGVGFLWEVVGDQQKFVFKMNPANRGKWIQSGLWKFSRHPNYFGEIAFWWGVFICAAPALKDVEWMVIISPIYITCVIMFGSGVPTTEKAADRRYWNNPNYQKYKSNTPVCFPFFPVLDCLPYPAKFVLCCEYRCRYEEIPDDPENPPSRRSGDSSKLVKREAGESSSGGDDSSDSSSASSKHGDDASSSSSS